MPELPEVEVSRRGLDPWLRGATVLGARLGKPLRHPLGIDPSRLRGLVVGPIARRGKYLWLPLAGDAGSGQKSGGLILHLGMSGSIGLHDRAEPAGPHDHFDLETSQGLLRLTDPRRFGAVLWSDGLDVEPARSLLARLGAEPFDPSFGPDRFFDALRTRQAAIKSVLLAGGVVVGAGNIYACEALFRAGIDPRRAACRISRRRAAALLDALRETMAAAVDAGGSTLRDFRSAHGSAGSFQLQARVYGREGQPCPACGTPVRRFVQQQRSTYFCPRCQR